MRHLSLQETDSSLLWEIILVDNASTDNTEQTALEYWRDSRIKLSVIKEPRPGLSHARHTGIENSIYDVIVFCDDDNWLFENYVQTAFDVIQADETIGVAGGEGIAVADGKLPDWFEEYKGYFACYPQAEKTGTLLKPAAFLYGAGLVVRKQAVEQVYKCGVKFLTTDRVGKKLVSGGDNELCYLLRLSGYKLWYDQRLKFYHYMPPQRLTQEYLLKIVSTIAQSGKKLLPYHYTLSGKKITATTWLMDVMYRLKSLCYTVLKMPFQKNKLKRKIALMSDWNSLIGVMNQFGKYKKVNESLLKIRAKQ